LNTDRNFGEHDSNHFVRKSVHNRERRATYLETQLRTLRGSHVYYMMDLKKLLKDDGNSGEDKPFRGEEIYRLAKDKRFKDKIELCDEFSRDHCKNRSVCFERFFSISEQFCACREGYKGNQCELLDG